MLIIQKYIDGEDRLNQCSLCVCSKVYCYLNFYLLTSKFEKFIFVRNCTNAVSLGKIRLALFKIALAIWHARMDAHADARITYSVGLNLP